MTSFQWVPSVYPSDQTVSKGVGQYLAVKSMEIIPNSVPYQKSSFLISLLDQCQVAY